MIIKESGEIGYRELALTVREGIEKPQARV